MARKMSRRLVALSSSAVAAVYLTGLMASDAAASHAPGARTSAQAALALHSASSLAAPSIVLDFADDGPANYRDGTFTGSGMSRRGGVDVAVTVQGGQITSAAITGGSTQYPLSRIAGLP